MKAQLQCETCPVRERAACASLSSAERAELARIGKRRIVAKGKTVFAAGDSNEFCATLISGALKVADYSDDGTERLLSLVHPAGFVGEMFAPLASHDVVALVDSELCVFGKDEYEAAIDRFPALAKALLRRSAQDLLDARTIVAMQSRRDSRGRVAAFLLSMAEAASHSPCHPAERFDLPLTRGEISALLGITIETASRQMSALERDGVIRRTGPRGIELVDTVRLAAEAA